MQPGTLYIVATPIGNLGDITLRALEILRSVDLIAAEDTRHTRKLLSHYDIHVRLTSYHSHNAEKRSRELIETLKGGQCVALVTDAGTPGISDPGTLLVQLALETNIQVSVIPGPTALIAALVASGLQTHPFAFLGFAPPRGGGRRRFFSSHSKVSMTLLLYESPQRFQRTLEDILEYWGDRRIAVARELTKLYEEVFRGTVSQARSHFSKDVKGEITIVVAGADETVNADDNGVPAWPEELRRLMRQEGLSVKNATDRIAQQYMVPRREVYQEALRARNS